MNKLIPQNFNDTLCLIGLILISIFWILTGKAIISLPDVIIGATIVTWTLLFNFYFRRAKSDKKE